MLVKSAFRLFRFLACASAFSPGRFPRNTPSSPSSGTFEWDQFDPPIRFPPTCVGLPPVFLHLSMPELDCEMTRFPHYSWPCLSHNRLTHQVFQVSVNGLDGRWSRVPPSPYGARSVILFNFTLLPSLVTEDLSPFSRSHFPQECLRS